MITTFFYKVYLPKAFLPLLFLLVNSSVRAQCPVTASVSRYSIFCGDTISLSAAGTPGVYTFYNDFNDGTPGVGWSTTSSAMFNNPCGASPGGAGDIYLWMGSAATAPRTATTNAYDLSTGGSICFDMRYEAEPGGCGALVGPCDCEGPDLSDEGVSLQYSTDGGASWTAIKYWDPVGGNDPVLTNWNNHCVTIPVGAMTTNTMIRWIQLLSSNQNSDHWGLNNVAIATNNPNFLYDWQHDGLAPSVQSTTPDVFPTSDTTYYVTYSDGNISCMDSVTVAVVKPTVTATANSYFICPGDSASLLASSSLVSTPPQSCGINSFAGCSPNSQAGEFLLGTGTVINTSGNCSQNIFGTNNAGGAMRSQILYRASELLAAGMQAGELTNIQFDIAQITQRGSFSNFTIKIGCTNVSQLNDWPDPFQTTTTSVVHTPKNVSVALGWNTFYFDNSYKWDGVSNVLVDICWNLAESTTNENRVYTRGTNVGFRALTTDCTNGAGGNSNLCNSSDVDGGYTIRPNTKFGNCFGRNIPLIYTWTPATGLSNPNIYNPKASPSSTTTYTVTVQELGAPTACASTDTVTIVNNLVFNLTAVDSTRCGTGSVPITINNCSGTVRWYTAASGGSPVFSGTVYNTPAISSTTTYYAACVVSGCESTRIPVVATIKPIPTSSFTVNPTAVCAFENTSITYTGNADTSATYNWSFGPGAVVVSGSGQGPYTVYWTSDGTKAVTLSVTRNGCTSSVTSQNVTVRPSPVADITPVADQCFTGHSFSFTGSGAPTAFGVVVGSYEWNFGGSSNPASNTSTAENPTGVTYPAPGTYIVTLRAIDVAPYNCASKPDTLVVSVFPEPTSSFTVSPAVVCAGVNTTITYTGTSDSTATYLWDFDGGTVASGSGQGPYTVNWSTNGTKNISLSVSQGSCTPSTTNATVNVSTGGNPVITVNGPSTFCEGDSVELISNVSTIQWSTGETTTSIWVSQSGNYSVTDTSNCAGGTSAPVTITVDPSPTPLITAGGPTVFCDGDSVVLASNYSSGNSWSLNGTVMGTNDTYTATQTGNFILTVTSSGCSESDSIFVNANPSTNPVITASGPTTFCEGDSVILTSSVNTVIWNPGGQTGSNITVATSGSYTATDTSGCGGVSNTETVTVNPSPNPIITPDGPTTFCNGDSVVLESNYPGNNNWNGGAGNGTSFTAFTSGTYLLEVTQSGCTGADSIVVTANPSTIPVITANGPVTFCDGDSVDLTSSVPNATWNPGGVVATTITVKSSNTYTVTDNSGCGGTSNPFTVTVNPVPVPVITAQSPTSICDGDSVVLESNYSTGNDWNGGAGNGTTFTAFAQGTYVLTVTQNGCSDIDAIGVTVNAPPTVTASASDTVVCEGEQVALSGAGAVTYGWDNGVTDGVAFTPASTQTYTVTGTDGNGCSGTDQISVTVNSLDNASFNYASSNYCQTGTDPTPTITGLPGGSFSSNPAGLVINTSTGTIDLNASNLGAYSVIYTTNGSCPGSDTVPVNIVTPPNAAFTYSGTYCENDPSNPSPTFSPGAYAGTFSANPAGLVFINTSTGQIDLSASTPGTYTVINVVSASGCADASDSTTVIIDPSPSSDFTVASPVCVDESSTINYSGIPPAGASYTWDFAGGTVVSGGSGPGPHTVNWSTSGPKNITLTVGQGNCSSTTSKTVTVNPSYDASFNYSSNDYCEEAPNAFPNITGLSGGTFSSNSTDLNINPASGEIDISASLAGSYTITYTTNGPCPNFSTFSFTINTAPNADFSYNAPYCINTLPNPLPVIAPGSSAGDFTATPSGLNFTNNATGEIDLAASNPGSYTVTNTVTDNNGCTDTVSFPVTVLPKPVAEFTWEPKPLTIANPNGSFLAVSSPDIQSWRWNFGGLESASVSNPSFSFPGPGSYPVQLTVSNGFCSDSTVNTIEILQEDIQFYIPNAFTPDGDGLNDLFGPDGEGIEGNYQMVIFDRWGEFIYETQNLEKRWDGTYKKGSKIAPVGVYVYKITFIDKQERKHIFHGNVSLLK